MTAERAARLAIEDPALIVGGSPTRSASSAAAAQVQMAVHGRCFDPEPLMCCDRELAVLQQVPAAGRGED